MRGKKTVSAILIALLVIMQVRVTDGIAYTDVTDDAWYADVTNKWGYLLAEGDDAEPEAPVSRAEFAHVLNSIMKFPAAAASFSDVSSSVKYRADIGALQAAGIVMGVGDGRFNPNATVSRAEVAVMFARAFALEPQGVPGFNDAASIPGYVAPYLNALQEDGYFKGDNNGNFRPDNLLRRCEIFQIIENAAANYVSAAGTVDSVVPGNMIIGGANTVLKNTTVRGNIIIAPSVGNGGVTLDNVILTGTLIIRGGGESAVRITGGSVIPRIFVNKSGAGVIRISVEKDSMVTDVIVSGGTGDVIIDGTVSTITLKSSTAALRINGIVSALNIAAQNAVVSMLDMAVVTELYIAPEAVGSLLIVAGRLIGGQTAAPVSSFNIMSAAVVISLGVAGSAAGTVINNKGLIESLFIRAGDTEVANMGSIKELTAPASITVTGIPPDTVKTADAGTVNDVYSS